MGLETVEIVMALEDHFGVHIPDQDASRCETVGDLVTVIVSLIAQQADQPAISSQEVFHRTQHVVSHEMKMPASEVTMDSKWVGDIT